MKTRNVLLIVTALAAFGMPTAQAATIELFDYGFNIDGAISYPSLGDPLPTEVDATGFDDLTGLGMLDITITGAGNHSVLSFFDHEIDVLINSFFNENGAIGGAPVAGQSWEIDEPGYVLGDIVDNFEANMLDNFNEISIAAYPNGDDVSMAMGFNFALAAGQTATVSFNLSETNSAPGFFLQHFDLDSVASIFLWGDLAIDGGGPTEPPTSLAEPGSLGLAMIGIFSILGLRRRRG